MNRKPRITSPCIAERYNSSRRDSRIIEFFDPVLQAGGLIEFKRTEDGKLLVIPYRIDGQVEVLQPRKES